MTPGPTELAVQPPQAGWARAYRAFMPDYNRKATGYWVVMVAIGFAVLAHAVGQLLPLSAADWLKVGVGTAITMLAGFFPLRVPRSKNSFAAGEIFIFLLLLLYGPAAATLAAAGEGLIGSWRTSKRWTSRIISPAMASIAMFSAGSLLQAVVSWARASGHYGAGLLLLCTVLGATLYFVITTVLITAVPYLKRNQWPRPAELFENFGWVGITFAGSASVACLLYLAFEQAGNSVLVAATPILVMLLTMLHFHFRQLEVSENDRKRRLDAVEREAELAARHVLQLEVSERRFHSAFTHASIGMALVSIGGVVLQANSALRLLLGVANEQALLHRRFAEFVDGSDAAQLEVQLQQLSAQNIRSFALELRLRPDDGREAWAALHGSFFSEIDSASPSLILQVQDVTARRQAQAGLHQIAFHDSLTGLPNRRLFQEELGHALDAVRRDGSHHFGLMFLDFDRFKLINDSLGHSVGDEFLVAVAQRIKKQLRAQDIVARLGGDEFAILAEDVDSERFAVTLAERLIEALRQPFHIAGTEITTSASIGITFSGLGYATPADMLRDADIAMYKAKANGKARFALFDSALHTEVAQRLRLEGDLRRALAAGQLEVAYQPLFDLGSGQITGFEALARWNHEELGQVSPQTFIGLAEEAGLIMPLTDFMLRSACTQGRAWQLRGGPYAELNIHVNVSGNDISHPGFVGRVTAALVEARLEPQYLTLELTENILMERLEAALPTLTELRRLGVRLSVDDFGAGFSSLRHLSKLPVNSLKVDRSFVADMQWGSDEAAVVGAIVLLSRSLGKDVIAEGIETQAQHEQLCRMGCGAGQGFYLSRPLAPEVVDDMLDGLVAMPAASMAAAHAEHLARLH